MEFKIQTPKLAILPLEEDDFPLALKMMQSPEVMRYIGKGVKSVEEARSLFTLFIEHQRKFGFSLGKALKRSTGEWIAPREADRLPLVSGAGRALEAAGVLNGA